MAGVGSFASGGWRRLERLKESKRDANKELTKVQNTQIVTNLIIHFSTISEVSEWASKRMSAAERESAVISAELVNEWAVRANEQIDERGAQYFRFDSRLFLTTVEPVCYTL